ncbi:MAG: amidohydrolase [Lysobacter sp.]
MNKTTMAIIAALAMQATAASEPSSAAASDAGMGAPLLQRLDGYAPQIIRMADQMWEQPELGYLETASSALMQDELRAHGFNVQAGVAGMPTAFVATAGTRGKGPVIALLAEMDALPGMSQAAVPQRQAIAGHDAAGQGPGHACGHNLFGAGVVGAAVALKEWLDSSGTQGEIRVFGTPAEEGGSGKVYMVRAGLFKDVDVALHWHPGSRNSAAQNVSLANISGKFRFSGRASHAAAAPERGRSALDGVESLNYMANMLREHVPQETRIHYVISNGGGAPNVVPATAEAYYYVRHPDPMIVRSVFQRLHDAAEGAALGTGTTFEFEQTGGVFSLLPNDTLGKVMHASLQQVGGVHYSPSDLAFAQDMQQHLEQQVDIAEAAAIAPYSVGGGGYGSTDVGDVSWAVPTVGMGAATWVPGTPAHSWQAVAASGMGIGHKGALVAAKALSLTAMRLFSDPDLVKQAREEFDGRRGKDFTYQPLLERKNPPLDYRR